MAPSLFESIVENDTFWSCLPFFMFLTNSNSADVIEPFASVSTLSKCLAKRPFASSLVIAPSLFASNLAKLTSLLPFL